MTRSNAVRLAIAVAGALLYMNVPVHAQGFAVRGGMNVNPDQFYGGGQYEIGPVVDHVWLQPNADLGVGDGATLIAGNFDVVYRKPLQRRGIWTAYAGGGPAINRYRLDAYSTTVTGAGIVAGLMHANRMFMDARVGFFDSPRLRVGVGYAFRPAVKSAPRTPRRRP